MMTRSRRKRQTAVNKEDRLSSLPDDLLTHILSFLSTEESFCTSFLSTRWKHLFASVPALSFGCFIWKKDESFVKFVNDVLRVHNVPCMKSFQLSVYTHCLDSDVCSWICAAVSRNPRLIELYAPDIPITPVNRTFRLPLGLFTCQMLEHLSLVGDFIFGVIETVRLPSLKTLYISNCKISDGDSASRLFSSCPVLEDLTFFSCDTLGVKVISISALSLKSLTIYSKNGECEWELNVPNLEYIRCGGFAAKWSSVTILKSLRKANVSLYNYGPADEDDIWELVNKFYEVQLLSLLHFSMESFARNLFSLPMFNKLTTLELKVDSCEGWSFFRTLLKRTPNLECLVILEKGFSDGFRNFPKINNLLPKRVPLCFSRSVKEVTMYITEGDKVEVQWLRYLLKNAKVLEKLTLFVAPCGEDDDLECSKREASIRKKLLAFPRSSKTLKLFMYVGYNRVRRSTF